ncbi:GNAT family N-acetyltransferase [Natronoglycomyces albus]|uniref:GNAT family N-acetyltransferase n=1 Tax=Natronoglycomyces albus TaxID=2811108 RepID=A0A895XLL4_9ACTN|nr:GNAT family N-acetyltransferase [Natronoglycomyces albus]QSB06591.1 GNAT family N-acetyltransferase [Natronoglycomyces albus]
MQITPLNVSDASALDNFIALRKIIRRCDQPEAFSPNWESLRASLTTVNPDLKQVREVAWEGETMVGFFVANFMVHENQHHANVGIMVHPEYRRRGYGSRLMRRLLEVCAVEGRTQIAAWTTAQAEGGPYRSQGGGAFLSAHGFTLSETMHAQVAPVDYLDASTWERLYTEAMSYAQHYEVLSWVDRIPDNLIEAFARLESTALSLMPLGQIHLENYRMDAPRLRRLEEIRRAKGSGVCQSVARHRVSGELVASTTFEVHAPPAGRADIGMTFVGPQHRGHRLGLAVKLANTRHLREHFPHVSHIGTNNAHTNEHMNAINRQLGFTPVEETHEYVLKR